MLAKGKIIYIVYTLLALICCEAAHAAFGEPTLLSVNQAFMFQARILENKNLEFYWQIAPGYHLYKDQLKIINSDNQSVLAAKSLPAGVVTKDPILGDSVLYNTRLVFTIPWSDDFAGNSLILSYQGCAESGFCYAPVNKLLHISANHKIEVLDSSLEEFPASEVDSLVADLKHKVLASTLVIFFGLGILLSFSPCVLPMIPLVLNLIIGNNVNSKSKAFILASCYVLGMASTYAIAGTLAGTLGSSLHFWLQKPIVLIIFSILLIITALHQFGMLKIKMPHFNKKLHHFGQKQSQGSIAGSLILGAISALIVSPCITPPLIGVLTYIGQNGSPVIGGITLLSLGLGMGLPLIIVAVLSSAILPIAGAWMNWIKIASGMALIALALWLLQSTIPLNLFKTNSQWQNVATIDELEKYLNIAKDKHQYTILEFYADWCASCRVIDMEVFANKEVQHNLTKFMLLRVNLTTMTEQQINLSKSLQVFGPPTIIFFAPDGEEQKAKRVVGSTTIEKMYSLTTHT